MANIPTTASPSQPKPKVTDAEERDGFVEYCKLRTCERMQVDRVDELEEVEEGDIDKMRVIAIEAKLEWRGFTDEMKMVRLRAVPKVAGETNANRPDFSQGALKSFGLHLENMEDILQQEKAQHLPSQHSARVAMLALNGHTIEKWMPLMTRPFYNEARLSETGTSLNCMS
ncbi:hypothetical protein BGZ98_004826 [Dissophora globulifera]|nr:hypothetical protein BGZ98_004826 [Dissophora globulifera]